MVFGFFRRTEDLVPQHLNDRVWCNDAEPTEETKQARFRVLQQIRSGNVPVLKLVLKVNDTSLSTATYFKGTSKLYEKKCDPHPSLTAMEEGEVIITDSELHDFRPHKKKRKRKRKRTRSEN